MPRNTQNPFDNMQSQNDPALTPNTDQRQNQIIDPSSSVPNPFDQIGKTDKLGYRIISENPSQATPPQSFVIENSGTIPSVAKSPEPSTPHKRDAMGFEVVHDNPFDRAVSKQKSDSTNQPLYKRFWSWANNPIIDIDDALGRTGQAGGFERGANSLVSGLTSPLSIALTLGTLGAGGLLESGAMSVLREAGIVGADALVDVTKGAQIVSDATKAGRSLDEGLAAAKAAGVNTSNLTRGLEALKSSDLGLDSLTSTGLVRRSGASALRGLGVSAAKAEKVAAGLQALTNAGFTAQNAATAAELSPKVLDALKDGEYDKAAEYATEALGTGLMAGLGAHEVAAESGRFMSEAASKAGLQVKPSETNTQLSKLFGTYDRDVATVGRSQELWEEGLRKQFGKMSPQQLERVKYLVESGNDEDLMAKRHNTIADIVDSKDRIATDSDEPITTGMTPERVQELVSSKRMNESYTPEELNRLKDAYDPRKLTDQDRVLAKAIVDKHNETLEQALRDETLSEGVENYSTNLWQKDTSASNTLAHDAQMGRFATNTSMARARMFDSSFEGQLLGKKLAETDPIALAANNANAFGRVKAAQDLRNRMLNEGVRAGNGSPLFAISGTGHVDPESGSVFVNPNNVRSAKISDHVIQGLKDRGELDQLVENGDIVNLTQTITPENIQQHIDRMESLAIRRSPTYDSEGNNILRQEISLLKAVRDGKMPVQKLDDINAYRPPVYAWNPQGYANLDHPLLRGVKHVAHTPGGDNVFLKSDVLVHPEASEYLQRRLGIDNQGPAEGAVGRGLLKANREGKGLLLFGSPFHVAQEALRALMTGVSPFGIEKWNLANDPVLSKGVEHGLTLGKDYRGLSAFKDGELRGHSALLSKTPGLNRIQSGLDHFLFDKYIPGLKARAYSNLVERYREAYPKWTEEKVAEVAAKDANERFGGINYAQLGRSAASQNWLRLTTLAPDWAEAELRSIGRSFGTEGKVARADMLKATAALWGTARVLNYLNSGSFHLEAPFGIATTDQDGKEFVYSIRTLPTDMLHAVSDPVGFVQGRFSPIVKTGTQLVTGRDDQGRKLAKHGLAVDLLRTVAPIPLQTTIKAATGEIPDVSTPQQVARAAGLTSLPYRSQALKKAAELASFHNEEGPVDEAKLERHQKALELEDGLRGGRVTPQQINYAVVSGELPQNDAKRIFNNYRQTRGMSPDQALLYTRAIRLGAPQLLEVWNQATNNERRVLVPLLRKARATYLKRALKEMTPAERLQDPTLRTLTALSQSPAF